MTLAVRPWCDRSIVGGGGDACSDRIKFYCKWNREVEAGLGGKRQELSLSEFTRATSAKRLQLQGHPLFVRACTSEWLRPCFYERLDLPRDS